MKNLILLFAVFAGVLVVNGCKSPELAGRPLTQEEEDFQQYIKQSYPGWEAPTPSPSGVRASSAIEDETDVFSEDIVINEDNSTGSATVAYSEYTVQKGDSLSLIAKKVYGNGRKYYRIQKANPGIKNPNNLKLGSKLRIPAL